MGVVLTHLAQEAFGRIAFTIIFWPYHLVSQSVRALMESLHAGPDG
jgi:hypothetical protein